MRILLAPVVFGLIAGPGAAGIAYPDPASGAASGPIAIRAQSNVCVSVRVDPRLLPAQRGTSTDRERALSNVLAFELGRRYERQGGSLVLSGRGGESRPRFIGNSVQRGGGNRACRRESDDIYVTLSYRPNSDGAAFAASYRIEQRRSVRSGAFSRDLAAEQRAGRRLSPHPGSPIPNAIAMDVRARADLLFAQLR